MESGVMCNVLQCQMRCALFILMWLWYRIRCNVEYVRYGVMLRHAMSRMVWNVVMQCGIMVWYIWNMVVCCDARCEMWLWNTERCEMVWRHRHGGVMRNDGWNAVWDVYCGLECLLWDSDVQFVFGCDVRGVVLCGHDVEWCTEMWNVVWSVYVKCGAMWNVAVSDMVSDRNAKCVKWNMAWCGMWCPGMCNVLRDDRCGKWCYVLSDVVV